MENEEYVIRMRKLIDEKKQQRSRMEGQLSELLRRLTDDYQYSSVEEGRRNLESMKQELEALIDEFDSKVNELKQKYPEVDL